MIAKPIIFDAESVRGILSGWKTQTRRVITPQPDKTIPTWLDCPYGFRFQSLWVREVHSYDDVGCDQTTERDYVNVSYRQGDATQQKFVSSDICEHVIRWIEDREVDGNGDNWRSPIHMPRWASRITLEITEVRVQRLQSISELDCEAELGVAAYAFGNAAYGRFRDRWESINAKRAYPWQSDPWVWALTFRVVQP